MHYEILSGQTKKGNKKAGDGNRTHVSSLEGWCSTIELHPHEIGVTGFEPATSWSQTRRSSQAEPHPEGFVCVLSVTQELVYSKGKNMSTTFLFFLYFFKVAAGQLKKACRQAFYPYTLQFNAYTLYHLHKHLFHGAKSLASMAYGILLLGSKLCRRAAVLI